MKKCKRTTKAYFTNFQQTLDKKKSMDTYVQCEVASCLIRHNADLFCSQGSEVLVSKDKDLMFISAR